MSAIPQSFRLKVGDYFRQLFQKPARAAPVTIAASTPAPTPPPLNGHDVILPLTAVLGAFPLELRSKILPVETQDLTLPVPFEKVMRELPRGAVTMTFGDIRRLAPEAFASVADSDTATVVLPLHEILSRLDPTLLRRRPTQRKPLVLPAEIASPFGGRGEGLTLGVVNPRPAPSAGESAPAPLVVRKPAAPIASVASFPVAAPMPLKPPEADERPTFARQPAGVSPDTAPSSPLRPLLPETPQPGPPPSSQDFLAASPVARGMQPASSATAAPAVADGAVLMAPLKAFLAAWPDALRQEIVQLNLLGAQLALPVQLIESSLRRGRVSFPWKTLRSWICPVAPTGDSPHDAAELELPLNVVTPLFFARQNGAGKSQRLTVDETIPNLFYGLPKPEPASAPKSDTSFYRRGAHSDAPHTEETEYRRPQPPSPDCAAKSVTPNEIVARAAALEGVAGVVIALPDGLLVSGRVPPEFNGDTLAAFLPQVFTKVSQSTKELRLGDLNNLSFRVGNVPWKIFRVNALFFAAFGRGGGPLPNDELARLAAELDHRR